MLKRREKKRGEKNRRKEKKEEEREHKRGERREEEINRQTDKTNKQIDRQTERQTLFVFLILESYILLKKKNSNKIKLKYDNNEEKCENSVSLEVLEE